jgi:pyruvate formate lyase activating enzyme
MAVKTIGSIFNIQSFSTTDGPGIRTVVFFQGCNMRCLWCHNPEALVSKSQVGFIQEKCIKCGNCAHERNPHLCYAGALIQSTRTMTVTELWNLIEKDAPYFQNSGGGVTFSGGECMLQVDFMEEIVALCRKHGVHTAVDTAGHVPYEWLTRVNPDLFLYDIKGIPSEKHSTLTGVDGQLIWDNLELLLKDGFEVKVRIPCIPEGNWEELPLIADKLLPLGVKDVELLEYHSLGEEKSGWYGDEVKRFPQPTKEEMRQVKSLFET